MVTVDLPFPPSTNRLWRFVPGKRTPLKSREYRAWLDEAAWLIKAAYRGEPIGHYGLWITVGRSSDVHIDLDNAIKPINDALKHAGAIKNDKDCQEIDAKWRTGLPGVRVQVLPTRRAE